MPDEPWGVDVTEDAVPERYDAKTELRLDVKPGPNTKDFDLQPK